MPFASLDWHKRGVGIISAPIHCRRFNRPRFWMQELQVNDGLRARFYEAVFTAALRILSRARESVGPIEFSERPVKLLISP